MNSGLVLPAKCRGIAATSFYGLAFGGACRFVHKTSTFVIEGGMRRSNKNARISAGGCGEGEALSKSDERIVRGCKRPPSHGIVMPASVS